MDELYREHAKTVYRFLLSLCGNTHLAEDLMQETFLQAYKSIEHYNGKCKMSVWLCQIARHLWQQYLQKSRHEIVTDIDDNTYISLENKVENQVLARYEMKEVLREMQKLSAEMREVVYLRVTGDLSFREIGGILGRSEVWARVNFYRAKELLWKGLNTHEQDKL